MPATANTTAATAAATAAAAALATIGIAAADDIDATPGGNFQALYVAIADLKTAVDSVVAAVVAI